VSTVSAVQLAHPAAASAGVRPMVSVVIPTRNRAVTLADTLAALVAQDYPADRLEVIVVDNDSVDDTEAVVRRAGAGAPIAVRYFRKDDRGPAAARNFGVARARGEVIAFTDSDCTMDPTWVERGVRRIAAGAALVAGPVVPVVDPRRVPSFFYHQTDHRRPNLLFPTANVMYRRAVLDAVGDFDERFGTYPWGTPIGGEDIDLAWRARRAGYAAAWADDAPVYHEASSVSARTWLIEPVRAQLLPRMVARIPELRRELTAGLFISREALAFYPAVAGLAAALGPWWPPSPGSGWCTRWLSAISGRRRAGGASR
jgi:glycosyltransferase involved in cell wall biosynthesis